MKKYLPIVWLALGAWMMLAYITYTVKNQPPAPFHEHADFAMFINGKQFDFSQDKYMTQTSCKVSYLDNFIPSALAHEGEDHKDDVHLHDGKGSIIHVHKQGIIWNDFFQTLKMSLADNAFIDDIGSTYANNATHEWKFIVNGVEDPHLSTREIRNFDEVLLSYGLKNRPMSSIWAEYGQVTNRACEQSGGCEHRNADVTESCVTEKPQPRILEFIGIKK